MILSKTRANKASSIVTRVRLGSDDRIKCSQCRELIGFSLITLKLAKILAEDIETKNSSESQLFFGLYMFCKNVLWKPDFHR